MTTQCSTHPSNTGLSAQRAVSTMTCSPVLKITFGMLFVACCMTPVMATEDYVNTHENRQQGPLPKKLSGQNASAHKAPNPHASVAHTQPKSTPINPVTQPHPGNPVSAQSTATSASKNTNNGTQHGIIFVGGHAQQAGATHALNPQPIPPGHAPDNKRTPPGPPTRSHSGHAGAQPVDDQAADAGHQH